MRYDGGKGTCFRQIINLMPPHSRYVETHLGGGAVMRHKRPAEEQVGIDLDAAVVELWRCKWPTLCDVVHGDAITCLSRLPLDRKTLIYADPPYYPATRRRSRVYRCDYDAADHERLLEFLLSLPCKVIISGYMSPLYQRRLATWSLHRFTTRTRFETREECLWFNYSKPATLHDDRYLGAGFRQREVIRRRLTRLRRRIGALSAAEQVSLHDWLSTHIHKEYLP